ncbi:hypothetical protein BV22DRAFT_1051414 [Leucogyrophana mollusca]|uniref:Uncharacterized protein n=1 Tax=Leucogyrophana mollusca TaxID=85980 RepID=A0ACB8AZC5_9AGAM|nr:hypothetical protein BV22DRAFT_1051414 [Leucogyrophana mollusca]
MVEEGIEVDNVCEQRVLPITLDELLAAPVAEETKEDWSTTRLFVLMSTAKGASYRMYAVGIPLGSELTGELYRFVACTVNGMTVNSELKGTDLVHGTSGGGGLTPATLGVVYWAPMLGVRRQSSRTGKHVVFWGHLDTVKSRLIPMIEGQIRIPEELPNPSGMGYCNFMRIVHKGLQAAYRYVCSKPRLSRRITGPNSTFIAWPPWPGPSQYTRQQRRN